MKITITKGPKNDTIGIDRRDGSRASTRVPHKGPVPHDVVHFFVERGLGIKRGFWGLVAAGHNPEEIAMMTKEAGHASAARPSTPDRSIVEAIQVERIVECFEADLWAGGSDMQTFKLAAAAGFDQSRVPLLRIEDNAIAQVRIQLARFRDHWATLPMNGACCFEWPESPEAHSSGGSELA